MAEVTTVKRLDQAALRAATGDPALVVVDSDPDRPGRKAGRRVVRSNVLTVQQLIDAVTAASEVAPVAGDVVLDDNVDAAGLAGALRPELDLVYVGRIATAVAALSDALGVAGDNALEAIPAPADNPLTADALRDDIANNVLPAIRRDLADLKAKVNELRTVLVNRGLVS